MCMKLEIFHDKSLTDFLFTDKLIHRTAGNIKPVVESVGRIFHNSTVLSIDARSKPSYPVIRFT